MPAMQSDVALPFAGIRVLELGHIVAGPAAGQIFADMGADVIKIESVNGGDQVRGMPGAMSAMFALLNRNKRSVALDLKGDGAEVFLKLADTADVIIDNYAYGAIDRLQLGYDVVSQTNPGIIWLAIKGFLPGPSESVPMLDELAQMAGGLAFMTGTDDKPVRAGASVIDIAAAAYGALAVMAALRQRERGDGKGQRIVSGLYETSVYLVGQWMATAQYDGTPSVPLATMQQGKRMGFSVYQLFNTADGERIFLGILSDAHWTRFCDVFSPNELGADKRFSTAAGRLEHRKELNDAISAALALRTCNEAMAKLAEANVPHAPIRRPDQLPDDDHLRKSGQLLTTPLPNGRIGKLPKLPVRASGFDMGMRRPVPALGADTQDLLEELGYSSGKIASLQERGAVIAHPGPYSEEAL